MVKHVVAFLGSWIFAGSMAAVPMRMLFAALELKTAALLIILFVILKKGSASRYANSTS